MENNVIQVKNLTRQFKQYKKEPGLKGSIKSFFKRKYFDITAVDNISFDIEQGEMVGFIGSNGAGKTTTLKMLSGILHPTSGQVKVLGFEPYQRKKEFLKQYALVMGQRSQLWWELPALEGFLLNKEIYEIETSKFDTLVNELSELLDVKEFLKVPVKKLSLGQRMKCELIAALLHDPKILFLDEPTIGLDVVAQKKIREFFSDYNKKKKTTIILTSHYMDDVEELCKRVIIINKGQKIYDGLVGDLIRTYVQDKYLKLNFSKEIAKEDLLKFGKIIEYHDEGLSVVLSVKREDHTKIAAELLTKLPVDDLDIAEVSLEDIIGTIFENN
jgi:ABC-2 type transport system ATP-binding protein